MQGIVQDVMVLIQDEYITTYTGKSVYPMSKDQSNSEYCLDDIIHPLSKIIRFAGHIENDYSVGWHAVLASLLVEIMGGNCLECLWALHHDDSEAYLCDIPKPIKHLFVGYAVQEEIVQNAIYQALGIPVPTLEQYAIVKRADVALVHHEAVILKHGRVLTWAKPEQYPIPDSIKKLIANQNYYQNKNAVKSAFRIRHDDLVKQCRQSGFLH